MTDIKTNTDDPNIFLVGFMGSGKSHWGKIWAKETNRNFIDLDEVIEKNVGKSIAAIFEERGEEEFRRIESAALRTCESMQDTIIASGGGTPYFYDNMQWMNEHGLTFHITVDAKEILKRVAVEQEKRPLFKNLGSDELLSFIEKKLAERLPYYSAANFTICSETATASSLTDILSSIKK